MTEKQYGGSSKFEVKNASKTNNNITAKQPSKKDNKDSAKDNNKSGIEGYDNFIQAGKITKQVIEYAKSIIKKDMKLLEIAEKIEDKIKELGGKPAFPVNLSINEIAAHDTPSWNDERKASGLLKVDIGVQVEGCVADTAFSLDLENNQENKNLILAAELAVNNAVKKITNGIQLREIGLEIEKAIKSFNITPIQNLSGHAIEPFNLHAGLTIPNFDNSQPTQIEPGVYAIEPFSTNGLGSVRDGRPSGIYHLEKPGAVRDNFAREVLTFIDEEYSTLPFCSRWIYQKFSSRGLLALRQIKTAGVISEYSQLIEKGSGKVAQAEHTVIITEKEKIITTL